jgi:DNA-binding Lrp family transcriptional regulator
MITSITLVRIVPVKDKDVYNLVKAFTEVKEIIMTYGEYDLVVKVESNSLDDLDKFIFNKLRIIDGVAATTTLIEAKSSSRSQK